LLSHSLPPSLSLNIPFLPVTICIYMYVYTYMPSLRVYTCTYIHICIYIYMYTYVCVIYKKACSIRVVFVSSFSPSLSASQHPLSSRHCAYTYIYVYIYICICVCDIQMGMDRASLSFFLVLSLPLCLSTFASFPSLYVYIYIYIYNYICVFLWHTNRHRPCTIFFSKEDLHGPCLFV